MEQRMETREKIFADARRKKEKRDQTVARMEWANAKRKDQLQSKINEDEERLAACVPHHACWKHATMRVVESRSRGVLCCVCWC